MFLLVLFVYFIHSCWILIIVFFASLFSSWTDCYGKVYFLNVKMETKDGMKLRSWMLLLGIYFSFLKLSLVLLISYLQWLRTNYILFLPFHSWKKLTFYLIFLWYIPTISKVVLRKIFIFQWVNFLFFSFLNIRASFLLGEASSKSKIININFVARWNEGK